MTQTTSFDIDTATAAATAEAVRHGKISALEACDAAIARIERRDGPINAVVVRDFDRARAAAKAIDAARKADDARPLLGVPMTIKESNDIAGLPSTWGFPEFKDKPVQRDGTVAARLKAAGAVLLGKSNVPVALGDWQTSNPIYGRTVNPHDHTRSPGGSSGGAAAALAAGMVPLEVGSDIGGSIRVPAHMCGVFGLKPSYGIIPLKGHGFPGMDGAEVELAVVGPMARSADDLALALDVLAGPLDGSGYRLELPAPRHRKLGEFRVLMLDTHPSSATDASVREPLHKLTHDLERAGTKIVRNVANLPDLAEAGRGYGNMLRTLTSRGAPGVTPIDAHAFLTLLDEQARLIRRWAEIFKEIDVVISPPFGLPAFPHDDNPNWQERTHVIDGVATPYGTQFGWAGLATFPNLPAAIAPIAKTKDGLPVGVQIMAGAFEDRTAIAFASLLEREGLARYERP